MSWKDPSCGDQRTISLSNFGNVELLCQLLATAQKERDTLRRENELLARYACFFFFGGFTFGIDGG